LLIYKHLLCGDVICSLILGHYNLWRTFSQEHHNPTLSFLTHADRVFTSTLAEALLLRNQTKAEVWLDYSAHIR